MRSDIDLLPQLRISVIVLLQPWQTLPISLHFFTHGLIVIRILNRNEATVAFKDVNQIDSQLGVVFRFDHQCFSMFCPIGDRTLVQNSDGVQIKNCSFFFRQDKVLSDLGGVGPHPSSFGQNVTSQTSPLQATAPMVSTEVYTCFFISSAKLIGLRLRVIDSHLCRLCTSFRQ